MSTQRSWLLATLIAAILTAGANSAWAGQDSDPAGAQRQESPSSPAPAPTTSSSPQDSTSERLTGGPSASAPSVPAEPPKEIFGGDKRDQPPNATQRQQTLAAGVAKEQAQEAAREAVAEARVTYEKALAQHRLNKAKIARLKQDAARAQRRAAKARREMGNMARLAYTAGDSDLNLVAALLDSQSPQEILSGAGAAARVASHKEGQWLAATELQGKADSLAAAAKELAVESADKLAAAEQALADAMDVARSVDLAIEPPKKVPPVDLTTKSDWVFPTASGSITSEAGMRMHPILGYTRCHAGADISAGSGTAIYAVDDGVVLTAGVNGGYGNYTLIAHGKALTSAYAHQQLILVKPGDRVTRGQLIGEVGTTGLSTGAHLHFEAAHHGVPYDPRGWLEDLPERRVPAC